jgi:TonB family protein
MNDLFIYLLKVSAGTTLLYLSYLLLFRKDTFYRRNRIFLILILLLPTLFPVLKIPVASDNITPLSPVIAVENMIFPESSYVTATTVVSTSFDYNTLFIWIYFTISGLLVLRIIISLISTYRIINKGTVKTNQFPKVIITDYKLPPFSFFPYAVIPEEEYKKGNCDDILDHEFAHIRQGHTFDLLLSEFFIAFQWFNPFVWFIKRSVILNHEYLADRISITDKSIKEYQYRLLNFKAGLKNISLAHTFNSLIKNRIIMINKSPTAKYATVKNILILPVIFFTIYAFAKPEYYNDTQANESLAINQGPEIIQNEVKGIILKDDGKPLANVSITTSGTVGQSMSVISGPDGRFVISNIPVDTYLILYCSGYKSQTIKADIKSEMAIKMIKNPEANVPVVDKQAGDAAILIKTLVLLDGISSDQAPLDLIEKLGPDFATIISLKGKEATDKYGEAGKNGVAEIYSKKKATELGISFPFRRYSEDDYPRFQGEKFTAFENWVINQIDYPADAAAKGIQGRIAVSYSIEADGSVGKVSVVGKVDPLISDEVVKAIQRSPKWEPAINPEARIPFNQMLSLRFVLPDKIKKDDVFVVVEKMPLYPGGDMELLKFIGNNTKYPDVAKEAKIEGRVIVRFVVSTTGNVEDITILKAVHPLLDEEAVRVTSMLSGFEPGMQGGNPVSVYYMVPITFALPQETTETLQSYKIKPEIGKKPLIVVDGVVTDMDASQIPSNTIASVRVTKGKQATDLYGEKAKDGVISITTGKSSSGKQSDPVEQ